MAVTAAMGMGVMLDRLKIDSSAATPREPGLGINNDIADFEPDLLVDQ